MRERLALLMEYLKTDLHLARIKNKKRFYTHYGGTC